MVNFIKKEEIKRIKGHVFYVYNESQISSKKLIFVNLKLISTGNN